MMIFPFFLMLGVYRLTRYLNTDVYHLNVFGRPRLFSEGEKEFLAGFNRLLNEDPKSLADPQRLAALDPASGESSRGSWTILRDGRELYRSARGRTAWGHSWKFPWPMDWQDEGASAADFTWNFRFADGSAGVLLFFLNSQWKFPSRSDGRIPIFFIVLILCNGFLGWWVSSSVIKPLARLRDAALRVGDGDLGFALAPAGPDELGQVTAAFETMRGKLRASLHRQLAEEASRKELIAHVSHDLRTPINLIRGYAEGLRDGVASTPEMRSRYLDTILERAGELEKLIETLFAFSRMDLEGVRPKLAAVAIVPFLENLRASLSTVFPNAGIRIMPPQGEADQGQDRPRVRADVELTRRVISNLVDNAVKHGGKPSIEIQLRVTPKAGMVELAVSDDGVGVAPEDLPRVFEPFFRGDRARMREGTNAAEYRGGGGSGAGLGLSIVAKIMSAQGGSARAGKGPVGGLEVTLTFREA